MRRISLYLVFIFIITGCDNKEELTSKTQSLNNPMQLYIINGDIEYYSEITDGSKPKKPIFVYDIPKKTNDTSNNFTSKTSEQSTFINFNYGVASSTKSGCTVTRYMESGKTYETDAGVYGPNPAPQNNGYLVRGYGVPHQNPYYGALVLHTSNKGTKRTQPRTNAVINDNFSTIAAISIEFPFKANVTYEISLKTFFNDDRKMIDKVESNGYPTLSAALENSGILFGGISTCENDLRYSATLQNYIKHYILEDHIIKERIITYKFSPTETKSALIFTLSPNRGDRGVNVPIPTNGHTMVLRSITITEKPFDPSLNITSPRR